MSDSLDLLGETGRIDSVAGVLRNIQQQRFNLDLEVTANDLDDDSPAPSAPQRTVKEQREYLREAEDRVLEEFSDLIPEIRARFA